MAHVPDPFLVPADGARLTIGGRGYSSLTRSIEVAARGTKTGALVGETDYEPTDAEHRFTSTGIKFWKHPDAMRSYRESTGRSVISTHISPEGRCNLTCDYCSVSHRSFHNT